MTLRQGYYPYSAGCAVRWITLQRAVSPTDIDQSVLARIALCVDRYFCMWSAWPNIELYIIAAAGDCWLEISGERYSLPLLAKADKLIVRRTTITDGTQTLWQQPSALPSVK